MTTNLQVRSGKSVVGPELIRWTIPILPTKAAFASHK